MFDLNVLPMNLSNGRNLGELPGLQVFPAPRKAEKSRLNDVLILLITAEKRPVSPQEFEDWGKIISDSYFFARGSFTMGITAAVKKITQTLEQYFPGNIMPDIFLNIAVLRGKALMIGHVGPVNTTIVFSDHVENFNDENFPGLGKPGQIVRFFQAEIHSGDLVLMCPRAPQGWTNEAILDATSESPLNVVRYLLDQARGNLQGAVIQIKAGTGEILYRYKPPITTNITLGYDNPPEMGTVSIEAGTVNAPEEKDPDAIRFPKRPGVLIGNDAEIAPPVYRLRVPFEPLPQEQESPIVHSLRSQARELDDDLNHEPISSDSETPIPGDSAPDAEKPVVKEASANENETARETDRPADADKPVRTESASDRRKRAGAGKKQHSSAKKGGIPIFLVILLCVLVPVIVAVTFSRIYSTRGKNQFYLNNLESAVETAKIAYQQTEPELQRISWEKVLEYLDEAEPFGSSKAATDLRTQAYDVLDTLEHGRKTVYHYALADQLPKATNLTSIESTSQNIYALDESSGNVLRFFIYNSGLTLDKDFQCGPGVYDEFGTTAAGADGSKQITVGKLIDFVLVPHGVSGTTGLAAIDADANLLYCVPTGKNRAHHLDTPAIGWLGIDALYYTANTLYVLDAKNEAIWRFSHLGDAGFSSEPKSYFGASAPGMKDVVDFVIYDRYAYLLRKNGTLIYCDYTGYDPACSYIAILQNEKEEAVELTDRAFSQIKINTSPDLSLYMVDQKLQSVVNASLKLNLVRYIVPDRAASEGAGKPVSGFGFLNQANLLWASGAELYNGPMP